MKVLSLVDLGANARERIAALSSSIELSVLRRDAPDFENALTQSEVLAGYFDPAELARAHALRWLQLGSAGADRYVETVPSHVIMTTASGVFGPAIAEHVLGMMLTLVRGIDRTFALKNARQWSRGEGERVVRGGLKGATLAIVGLGDIGRALAVRAKALEMHVLAVRRRVSLPRPPGVDEVRGDGEIDGVLERSDHVVLALPATKHTDQLIDARRLARMKRGSYIYNVGRGNAIDETALLAALKSGALAGAGLDVFAVEPLPADSALYTLDNVVISPHCAGSTPDYAERFAAIFVDNLERYLAGRALENSVDRTRGY